MQPGSLMPAHESRLAAMHYGALGGSTSLIVGGRAYVRASPRAVDCGSVVSRHSVVILEPGAYVDLRVDLEPGSGPLDLSFVELVLGEGSAANVLIGVRAAGPSPSASGLRAALGRGSRLNYALLGSGDRMHRQDDRMVLGPASSLRSGAFLISRRGAGVDRFLGVEHSGEDSSSSASAVGVALDGGYVVVRGLVSIGEGAARSRADFTAGVALLGEGARGHAAPMLEVHTGDVLEARHHSFEAKPGPDQLFYLRSRGLSEPEARDLIITGFAESQLGALEGRLAQEGAELLRDLVQLIGDDA
ncbi:MAG: SufD family Fe-S cluster assembly protein [Nitrososphaeria archaeon]